MPSREPPNSCVSLAASAKAQAVYVTCLLLGTFFALAVFDYPMDVGATREHLAKEHHADIGLVVGLFFLMPAVLMFSSRVLAPCCCPLVMEGVPPCCTETDGRSLLLAQLDTPWYVMVVLGFVFDALLVSEHDDPSFRREHTWIFILVGLGMLMATIVCAIVKLLVLSGCFCAPGPSDAHPLRARVGSDAKSSSTDRSSSSRDQRAASQPAFSRGRTASDAETVVVGMPVQVSLEGP